MKNAPFFLAFFLCLHTGMIKAQKIEPVQLETYASCCGVEPVEFIVPDKSMYIFVPNAFTPNEDGWNDKFMPAINGEIQAINYMVIQRKIANDSIPLLVYQIRDVDAGSLAQFAWNGKDEKGNVYQGAFDYAISVTTKTGASVMVKGSGCSIVCGPEAALLKDKKGCFYPVQTSNAGHLDPLIPNKEEDCFE